MHELSDFWPFFATFAALVAAGFGFPIPEEVPTIGAGIWVGSHPELGPLRWLILPVCFAGVLVSDVFLYSIGRWWGPRLLQNRWAKRLIPPEKWRTIEENYDKHGIRVLLMVRWLPAIRSPLFISAGIMRLSFVRFVIADGAALIFGHSLLFFLAWWFGDAFQELVDNIRADVDHYRPVIVMVVIAALVGFLLYHFLKRPVSTADPKELPLIGERVANTIEHLSGEIIRPKEEKMFEVDSYRRQFPALASQAHGQPAVFFDGPAGSQVPARVAEAMSKYLLTTNANHGGAFTTARESDSLLHEAHRAVADFLGTTDPQLVAFGANMTTLTFALSRALARTWQAGDEVIVTRLDHDANVTPWVLAARDAGAEVRHVGIRTEDCTLDLDDFRKQLSSKTRLVAVGCASNAVGTINPVKQIIEVAHAAGAQVFLDAVHYAPHALIDVTAWDCDFLACSAYKFFGPHAGILYGKREHMEKLPAYKLRPVPDTLPDRWMTGTQSHEAIAGTLAAVEYLAEMGSNLAPGVLARRDRIGMAFDAIGAHERGLAALLLRGLCELRRIKVYGITDRARLAERVPTVSLTHERLKPREVAEHLDKRGIFVWHGNYYALALSEALGREPEGMVRIGLLHYNTADEVNRLLAALAELE